MAGVYIHIPFCKSRCRYCDFFSTTQLERRKEYVDALLQEITLRKNDILREPIHTLYFGGGTPSLLDIADIEKILHQLYIINYTLYINEVTLEANPQDLTPDKLQAYRALGINRLSIGIQSFQEKHLTLLGRRHNAEEAIRAVQWAQEAGFENISIDLIYGIPEQTVSQWEADIQQALALNVPHISTYNLIYEEGTRLTQMLTDEQITPLDEDTENQMYEIIVRTLQAHGYNHYEVSNFCKSNYHSRHNSAYWDNTPYIGIGAGAHSYAKNEGQTASGVRMWNTSDLDAYISSIQQGILPQEQEILTPKDTYNERVMLGLRTQQGIALGNLSEQEKAYCLAQAQTYIERGMLSLQDDYLRASLQGSEILNQLIVKLMKDSP